MDHCRFPPYVLDVLRVLRGSSRGQYRACGVGVQGPRKPEVKRLDTETTEKKQEREYREVDRCETIEPRFRFSLLCALCSKIEEGSEALRSAREARRPD